jgi:hypothetical protein
MYTMEGHKLRMLEKGALKRIFERERKKERKKKETE